MNPKVYNFEFGNWHRETLSEVFKLKTKETVIFAGTIVNKDNQGKVESWHITNSNSTGALYIIAQDTVKDVETCVCLYGGEVLVSHLKYPTGMQWDTVKNGVSILDSMNLRSQIILIEGN